MQARDYLKYIMEEIHSTVFATVDSEGRPVTCAIDIMDYDESGLYFLTARGKNFYDRLKANDNIAFTAMKGKDTLSCTAVSVQGKVQETGPDRLPALFEKIHTWKKFIPMYVPAAPLPFSKSMREPANGLTSQNGRLNGKISLSAAHRRRRPVIL